MRSRPSKKRKGSPKGKRRVTAAGLHPSCWARTDVGLKREINEDAHLVDSNLNLYIVADGMGGHAGGNVASKMSIEIIRQKVAQARRSAELFSREAVSRESPAILQMLSGAVRGASASIFSASNDHPELSGMGTTVTLLLTHGTRAYVAHVGDSRLYRFRDGRLEQLTEDHSLVNEQVKAGVITSEEALHSRFRNIITRSVGFESEVNADTTSLPMKPADIFLLCSDGLTGMVEDERIAKTIRETKMSQVPVRLVDLANRAGGEDNITVVVLRYGDGDHDQRVSRSRRAARGTRKNAKGRKKARKK